jgi:pimeloyl-ACP methyl ester carboxylesterase
VPESGGDVIIDGVRLETQWIGPAPDTVPGHPALVFLHEGLGSISQWRDFPACLAEASGLGALVYSRQGHGGSDPAPLPRPMTFMHDEAFDTVGPLLDRFGISSAVLVGHSDGASIAAIYAGGVRDERLKGLILMAPHFVVEEICIEAVAAARHAFETGDLRDRLARHHGANVDGVFRGWHDVWAAPEFRAWDIGEFLPAIAVPTLIIQGEDDRNGTLRQIDVARARCTCPLDVAVLARCGHIPFQDQPERTLSAAADFVRRLQKPAV